MEQIIRSGGVTRGWLGVSMQDMTEELADVGKVDLQPKMEGRQIIMVLSSEVQK